MSKTNTARAPRVAPPAPKKPSFDLTLYQGSYTDAREANDAIVKIRPWVHIISPSSSIGRLPEGCEVMVIFVEVDPTEGSRDVYRTENGLGISKTPLLKISAAADVSWVKSERVDDGSDPLFCSWSVEGSVPNFDGSRRTISDSKIIDLRDNSPEIQAIRLRYKRAVDAARDAKKDPPKSPELDIAQKRAKITENCETKAKLRAVRSGLGLQTSYSAADLTKPFAVVKVVFTGFTQDPVLRAESFRIRALTSAGAIQALFGMGGGAPLPELAASSPAPALRQAQQPPPRREIEAPASAPTREAPPPARPTPRSEQMPPSDRRPAAAPPAPVRQERELSGLTVPFGRDEGTPVENVDDDQLEYLRGHFEKAIANPKKARWVEENTAFLEAINAEIEWRGSGGDEDQDHDDDDGEDATGSERFLERTLTMTTFETALAKWKASSLAAIDARSTYERAYATAVLASDAKNAEGRKAQADLATANLDDARRTAEVDATADRLTVDYLIARAPVSP